MSTYLRNPVKIGITKTNAMKFKITKCIHVTAIERKHLCKFLESGMTQAQVNTKVYTVLEGDGKGWYKIRIATPYRTDSNQLRYNMQLIELTKI